jgi:cyclase
MKLNLKCLTLFLGLCVELSAQNNERIMGKGAYMDKIGNDIYAIIHEDATDEWPHGNTGVIVGDDEVLVVDACYLPSMAKEDIRLIKSITNKPVKYLVYTHWHFDHNNGAVAYKESFPAIIIISERESQRFIELNAIWWSKMNSAPNSLKRKSLDKLQTELDSAIEAKVENPEKSEKLKNIIASRQNELKELETLQVLKPDKTFDNEMTVNLGKRKVILTNNGKGNSPKDVTIYLPEEQILFTGDLLVQSPLPYFGASWPIPWVKVLEHIETIPIKAMVLGHGPVQYDHSYTRQVKEFLQTTLARVEALILEGKTLDEIKQTIDLNDMRKGVWSNEKDLEDWKTNVATIVERMWRGIRGQG